MKHIVVLTEDAKTDGVHTVTFKAYKTQTGIYKFHIIEDKKKPGAKRGIFNHLLLEFDETRYREFFSVLNKMGEI